MVVLDAGIVIRAASGALLVALGLTVVAVGRRKRGPVALGLFLASFGGVVLVGNLGDLARPPAAMAQASLAVVTVVCGLLTAIWMPTPLSERERPAIWIGAATGLAGLLGILGFHRFEELLASNGAVGRSGAPSGLSLAAAATQAISVNLLAIALIGLTVTVSWRLALVPPKDRVAWIRATSLALVLGPFMLFYLPTWLSLPLDGWSLAATAIVALVLAAAWLVVAHRTERRSAVALALLWPAVAMLSYAYLLLPANAGDQRLDAYGMLGLLRLAGWSVLVHAILRADLLGVPLPRFAVSKGAVGAGALAVLFIVAQVAQNFFSAQYGLYMGGIIAGTFLFVASPVQKAIERRAGNAPAKAGTRPGKEEAYRSALRFALRDRALSPQERIALAHLADELGLTAGRAAELESEVVDDGITPKSSARRPAGRPRS